MAPVPISRRRAIALGGLGAVAVAGGATVWLAGTGDAGTGAGAVAALGAELIQPPLLDSRDGRLQVELTAAMGAHIAGRDTHALAYNGSSPGPTLRVRPGDELAVRLINNLDEPTNLHTHGLRVSPLGNSDNPFLAVEPGTSFDYLFQIPPDHPAGTYWYHPHHHGMVANQIFGGLLGALLVEAPGQEPELPAEADRVLQVTDITLEDNGDVAHPSVMERNHGRQGNLVLVNGQYQPTITAVPDAMQRWRIINSCVARVLAIRLQDHQLHQIAHDGTYLSTPIAKDQVLLGPGNRIDVLVRPSAVGRYELSAEPFERGSMGSQNVTSGAATLAIMNVDGRPAAPTPLPDALPAETPTPGVVVARRQIEFEMNMGGPNGEGASFTIDRRTFDPNRDDQTTTLGSIEEWTVTNTTPLAHPFHLHVWPFTVLASSDDAPPLGIPQDVVLIPANGWVRLRIPFTRFAGRSVYHCHILDHEDLGMMATVNVQA
ncbi:multicopper oxidase family protein [Mycolicibacterium hodleri]|uniref:Multicopper oxidase family protein n=1 Tax=Mycolicibacterium hodleri TaxID=49897 RepID=A0A502EH87_9MYCO|nr:multicopper oxidase family protein [Mycolicibacterium hodleri]TPG36419.1 multicopper oxidase family protein [Mycolicibacterium hodleri]